MTLGLQVKQVQIVTKFNKLSKTFLKLKMLKRFRVEENSEKNDVIRVPVETMRKATEAIFRVCGLTQSSASICTDVLISNDLRGNDSHGVSNMLRKVRSIFELIQ